MKELVEVIAKALVDNPDEVVVTEAEYKTTLPVQSVFQTKTSLLSTNTEICIVSKSIP